MFEIGISTASLFNKAPNEKAVEILYKWGIPVCEVFLSTFSEYESEFVEILVKNKKDLKVHSVHSLTNQFEPQLFNSCDRTRLDAEVFYRKMCYSANRLQAGFYTFHGAALLKKGQRTPPAFKLKDYFQNLVNIAKEYDVKLSLENVHWAIYNSNIGFFKELSEYVPIIKGTLDIKQAMQADTSYKLYLSEMKSNLSTVHLCDYTSEGKTTMPGKGIFNFKELFSLLLDINSTAPCILEVYSGDYIEIDDVLKSYEFLQNELYKVVQSRKH